MEKIFDSSLNQLDENSQKVKFEDLVIAKKNDKLAIFNKENSTFLTEHEFDRILLSESGHHIVQKADDLIDEEGRLFKHWGKITYSAVVDNYGNIKEFEDLDFGYKGSFIGDVCPAFYKKTGKVHLVDYNKGVISEGFSRIMPVNSKYPYGLYFGLKKDEDGLSSLLDKFIYKDGTNVNITLDNYSEYWKNCKINEIKSISDLLNLLKNYGANILEFTSFFIFRKLENFYLILKTINEYHPEQLLYTIGILEENILYLDIVVSSRWGNDLDVSSNKFYSVETENKNNFHTYKLNHNSPNFEIDFEINAKTKIEANFIKKKVDELYDNIKKRLQ